MALKPLKQPNWPAPEANLERAEDFLRGVARRPGLVLVCGRSLDALSATALLERVLRALETPVPEVIFEDLPWKRGTLSARVRARSPQAVVCLGLHSPRQAVPAGVPALVLGGSDLPSRRKDVTVLGDALTRRELPLSLLTWFLASRMVSLPALEWLALLGTLEEAGLHARVPGYQDALKRHGKVPLTECLTTVHAASHAADFDPQVVVQMLATAGKPLDLALGRAEGVDVLRAQRDRVQQGMLGAAMTPPKLTPDLAISTCASEDLIQPLLAARVVRQHPERVSLAINTGADRRCSLVSVRSRCETTAEAFVERLEAELGTEPRLAIVERHRRGLELSLPHAQLPRLLEAAGAVADARPHEAR